MTRNWSIILAGIFACFLGLQYRLWFQADGIRDMYKLKENVRLQQAANAALKQQNAELAFNIARGKESKEGMEARARKELGMIKQGETFYQIVH